MKVKVNGTNLFFDIYGSKLKIEKDCVIEKPTLIVLHGGHGFADHTLYVEFWSRFSDIAQVIFLDQRGCGRSDPAKSSEWNLKHWADDLHVFCQTLEIDNPIIAGVSMGGHVMCEYITRYASHTSGLIFCNTEARFVLDEVCEALKSCAGENVAEVARRQFQNPSAENLAEFGKKVTPYYGKKSYSPEELSRCIKHQEVFLHFCKNEMLKFNYLDELHKINCPTLFMVGADSPTHLLSRAEEMASRIQEKYVHMAIIEDAGGSVYKDQPEEAYKVVREFLGALMCARNDSFER